jgi:hypothetical protein
VVQAECGMKRGPLWWGETMPISDPALWSVIRDHPLPCRGVQDNRSDPHRVCASFADCLRMKGDWTDEVAARITLMYRQFLYLKALSGQPVSPSACVDMAWHLHLEFKEDYAALCRAVGRGIPHIVDLSYGEQQRAHDRGHQLYQAEFDAVPARDLWPSGQDQTNAEWLWLMQLGGLPVMLLCMLGVVMGVWPMAVPVLAILGVNIHFSKKWGGVRPEQMSRCG